MNTLGSIETLKQKAENSAPASPSSATGIKTDPAVKTKEEQSKRLESLMNDLGKSMKQLLEGSEEHEQLYKTAKQFSKHEANISRTLDKTFIQMQGNMAEITAVADHMHASVQKIPNLCAMYDALPVEKEEYRKSADKTVIKF